MQLQHECVHIRSRILQVEEIIQSVENNILMNYRLLFYNQITIPTLVYSTNLRSKPVE